MNKLLYYYVYFLTFPIILIGGQNLSIFFFVVLLFHKLKNSKIILQKNHVFILLSVFLFLFSAFISVFNISDDLPKNFYQNSLSVLPNYLYWGLLILYFLFFHNDLNYLKIYKCIFFGLLSSIIFYIFLQSKLSGISWINRVTPNNFSFLLICYTPVSLFYLRSLKIKFLPFFFFIFILFVMFAESRRAGFILVFLGGIFVYLLETIDFTRLIKLLLLALLFYVFISSNTVQELFLKSNERLYQLIFDLESVKSYDRSYLWRVAQFQKGIAIFEKYPFFGIGLNNFTSFSIDFNTDFEGSEFVINKNNIQFTSSHNSYINILAEGGLFLLVPFLSILFYLILKFIFNIKRFKNEQKPLFIGLIFMSIHLYYVTAIINVYAWLLIALCSKSIKFKTSIS